MRVPCEVEETLVEVDGKSVVGIVVTCSHCDRFVEVPGHDSHETRVLALNRLHRLCATPYCHHFIPADTDE